MIDSVKRASLSQNVRWLIGGRMTNDGFDDVYFELCSSSDDKAITEIARFCWGLYSSDLIIPYRLKGIHAVDEPTRSAAKRCILFLRSGLEYEWPALPERFWAGALKGIAFGCGLAVGVAISLVSFLVALLGDDLAIWLPGAVMGGLLILGSLKALKSVERGDFEAYQASGNFDVWPFIRQKDFENALHSCRPFASSASPPDALA